MEKLNALIDELRSLIGNSSSEANQRKKEILLVLKSHEDEEEVSAAIKELIDGGMNQLQIEVDTLKEKYADTYSLLPLSYIAQHYFGKSRAWLYQRINGYKVRGHIYSLSDAEKVIFNNAVQDVAKRIGSVRLS